MREPHIGELDKRMLLRRRNDFPVPDGGLGVSYPSQFSVWAKLTPVGGAIYYETAQTDDAVTHRAIIRLRSGVTAEYGAVVGGIAYRVRRVAELGRSRRWLVLDLVELGQAVPGEGE